MRDRFLPLRLGGWMLTAIGAVLLAAMVWISTWARDPGGAFVTDSLPGYRFLPEILPRLGEIGGGALGLGLALIIIAAIMKRRAAR